MLDELTQRIVEFRDARDWKQFHSARNLATSISIESGELLELFQWSTDATLAADVEARRADLERELADVVIYALLLAHEAGVDLEAANRGEARGERFEVPGRQGSRQPAQVHGTLTSSVRSRSSG